MKCPTCDVVNPADARFCGKCATALDDRAEELSTIAYCAGCGSENSLQAQTCIRCGSDVHAIPHNDVPADVTYATKAPGVPTGTIPHRDISELLSETFRILRGKFWVFAFIAFWAQIPFLIAQIPQIPQYVDLLLALISYAVSVIAIGAITFALSALYTGKDVKVGECYNRAWSRCLSLLGSGFVYLIALLISIFLMTFIIGFPLFFFLLVSLVFYTQAIILEGRRGPWEALKRSYQLVKHQWWRTFGTVGALIVMGFVISLPAFIAISYNWIAGTILFAIAGIVTTPLVYIGSTLVYFDLRVRKEGYTLETMSKEVGL